jgi:hypothetical protein
MSDTRIESNVYYLPVPAAPVAVILPAPSPRGRWATFKATMWRLRFAVAEVRAAFREPVSAVLLDDVSLTASGGAPARGPRRGTGAPARVLDFTAFAARETRRAREAY